MLQGIVYGTKSKIVRRIVVVDDETELEKHPINVGESLLTVEADHVITTYEAIGFIADHHNITRDLIPTGRCAVVDGEGIVRLILMADPHLDSHIRGRLVLHPTARIGDKLDD